MSRPRQTTHGDYGYAKRFACPCPPCRQAERRYVKGLHLDHARGIKRRVDATPVREHVQGLLDLGLASHQISSAAGIAPTVLKNLMEGTAGRGPAEHVLRPTEEKILAVTWQSASEFVQLVPADGVIRRLQALEYVGHAKTRIADELDVTFGIIHFYHKQKMVRTTTVASVHEVYVRLRDEPGTSVSTMWKARRRAWLPPMCWDDETIDDPYAKPGQAVCIVTGCVRGAASYSLCEHHRRAVRDKGGFERVRNFKVAVDSLTSTATPRQLLVENVLELRGDYSAEDVARRFDITASQVERIWNA